MSIEQTLLERRFSAPCDVVSRGGGKGEVSRPHAFQGFTSKGSFKRLLVKRVTRRVPLKGY